MNHDHDQKPALFQREHAILPPDGDTGRKERGAYYTPDALALALAQRLDENLEFYPENLLEPGCGGGAFLRAAQTTWPSHRVLLGVDLKPACSGPGSVEKGDLFECSGQFDLVLGNPDFKIAEKVVRHCLGLLRPGGVLAFLLRCGFEMSQERIPLFDEFPLFARAAIPQRPSFTGGGTDSYDYALFVWKQGFTGEGRIWKRVVWR